MIHPTAIVETSGTLADDVEIGPYAIVQGAISLAAGCVIGAHAQLLNRVALGEACTVGPGTVIGSDPQDLSFAPATVSGVVAGRENVFREYVTVHRSSRPEESTRIGTGNFFMSGAHVGHDCVLGDRNVIANNCLLGGHVTIGNRAFLGGGSVYHQFVRVGDLAIVQGNGALSMDLPPYLIAHRVNEVAGLNRIGLRRARFDPAVLAEIRDAFTLCYRSGLNLSQSLAEAATRPWNSPEVNAFLDFLRAGSKKGICVRLSRSS